MAAAKFTFRGLVPPVFNKFNKDDTVCVDWIPEYAKFLKDSKIEGVLVNGTTGEGRSMTVEERKKVLEKWIAACKEFKMHCMVHIGGAPYPYVCELARHAAEVGADSMLCLPELYFRPHTEEDLVEYLQNVSSYAPNVPILYYHYPLMSNVNLNMPRFITLAKQKIPAFGGIKYTSGDLDQIAPCANEKDVVIFMGLESVLFPAFAMGFDSTINTTLSIYPEMSFKVVNAVARGNFCEGRKGQIELKAKINEILRKGPWVPAMKAEFNQLMKARGLNINAGNVRFPLKNVQ